MTDAPKSVLRIPRHAASAHPDLPGRSSWFCLHCLTEFPGTDDLRMARLVHTDLPWTEDYARHPPTKQESPCLYCGAGPRTICTRLSGCTCFANARFTSSDVGASQQSSGNGIFA